MMTAQRMAFAWAVQTYGEVAKKARYQAFRFLEEALELVQAMGLTKEDAIRTVEWVFSRSVGTVRVEVGDVRLSIDILAESQGVSSDDCYTACASRISDLDPAQMRAKEAAKIMAGLI